ncbi:SIS domain-containing protein [bacterium]|nr:SIS domain-containing protein [bacterium]
MSLDKATHIRSYFERLKAVLDSVKIEDVEKLISIFEDAFQRDAVVFVCGNGGSWSTASHWVCDFSKGASTSGKRRFRMFALGDNVPMLTAYGNDVSYNSIFAEPLRAYARPGDVVVLITASGNSPNILEAAVAARELKTTVVGLIGFGGGKLAAMTDHNVIVESREYGPVEDLHLVLDHIVSTYMKEFIAK